MLLRKFLLVLMLVLLLPLLSAEDYYLTMDVNIGLEDVSLGKYEIISSDNPFYSDMTVPRAVEELTNEDADVVSISGVDSFYQQALPYGDMILFEVDNFTSLRLAEISQEGIPYYVKDILFCNHNDICEPCLEDDCAISENSLTCSDCPASDLDGYCELKEDGICDPDCGGEESDCEGCNLCFFEGMDTPVFCSLDLGGEICTEDEKCVGPREEVKTIDADKGKRCCVGDYAFCANAEELSDESASYVMTDRDAVKIYSSDRAYEPTPVSDLGAEDEIFYLLKILGIVLVIILIVAIAIFIFIKKAERIEPKGHIGQLRDQMHEFMKKGYTKEQLRKFLVEQGYDKNVIEEAFK